MMVEEYPKKYWNYDDKVWYMKHDKSVSTN